MLAKMLMLLWGVMMIKSTEITTSITVQLCHGRLCGPVAIPCCEHNKHFKFLLQQVSRQLPNSQGFWLSDGDGAEVRTLCLLSCANDVHHCWPVSDSLHGRDRSEPAAAGGREGAGARSSNLVDRKNE